jgi:hypothetical protein
VAPDDVVPTDPVPTSRRSVLKQGAKLAYAAPVVAMSMRIGEHTVTAVSGDGCPACYVFSAVLGRCIRPATDLAPDECPCGFTAENGQCVKDFCRDCFENIGGICVPENPAPANGLCDCGFQNIGGICVPRYPL